MKLINLRIKKFQQFRDITLDFSDKNGEPAEKICFIGKNGTGKSTILKILDSVVGRTRSFQLIQEPQPLLSKGKRTVLISRNRLDSLLFLIFIRK